MRSARRRVLDMLQAIDNIQRHTLAGAEPFRQDEVLQGYVLHQLMILSEAAYQMPDNVSADHPEIAWRVMAAFRHVLGHGYFTTDLDAVWGIIERDLPALKPQLERMLLEYED